MKAVKAPEKGRREIAKNKQFLKAYILATFSEF